MANSVKNLDIQRYLPVLVFALIGVIQGALYLNLSLLNNLAQQITIFLLHYAGLFIVYLGAIHLYRRNRLPTHFSTLFPIILVVFSVVFRCLMVLTGTTLSTDLLRYMWDGRLLGNGVDPYQYPPSSPALERFQSIEYYERYDHKDEFTIYPPFAQLIFAAIYRLFGDTSLGFKSVVSIFDFFNGLLILGILRKMRADQFHAYYGALIYLWNPLVIIEFSNSGHIDAIAIFLFLASLYLLTNSSIISSSVFMVTSVFTKWFPLLIIPFYLKYLFQRRRLYLVKMILLAGIVSIIMIAPFYLSSGLSFLGSLGLFFQNWRFESALSRLVLGVFQIESPETSVIVKILSYGIFLSSYLIIIYSSHLHKTTQIIDYSIIGYALFYLVIPTIYPWYALWLLMFTTLIPIGFRTGVSVCLTGIAVINYIQEFYPLSQTVFWGLYILWYIPVLVILLYYVYQFQVGQKLMVLVKKRVSR